MKGILLIPLSLLVSILLITGCDVTRDADIAAKGSEGQSKPAATKIPATVDDPAIFSLFGLSIEPREIQTGDFFTISVTVTNNGSSRESYNAILYIDEVRINITATKIKPVEVITKSIELAAGDRQKVIFDRINLQDGLYTASIGELKDYFEVGC